MDAWGRVDIVANNAGVQRDKSFAKMSADDFRAAVDVHLMGAFHCSRAVWPHVVAQKRGRIVMTTSSSARHGNFGQSDCNAASMALLGLMQTLPIEGAKHHIRANRLAPTAATCMTEGLIPLEQLAAAWAEESARAGERVPASGSAQGTNEVTQAFAARA